MKFPGSRAKVQSPAMWRGNLRKGDSGGWQFFSPRHKAFRAEWVVVLAKTANSFAFEEKYEKCVWYLAVQHNNNKSAWISWSLQKIFFRKLLIFHEFSNNLREPRMLHEQNFWKRSQVMQTGKFNIFSSFLSELLGAVEIDRVCFFTKIFHNFLDTSFLEIEKFEFRFDVNCKPP